MTKNIAVIAANGKSGSAIAIVDELSAATDDAHIGERISVRW
ncbi:NADH-flavin reductase [Bifidobacterium myosotis]|uniref:NADH-flavin reductase n=1 Tax=Bifidobacterium myosotis TaxID=1630166 RepID=A0A261FJT1_9BIFI|nr:hypothetical protein [Bifidobacterium myosotis]OZG59223.1 NADH-flavin reductase [Bifidobacterium myosotis]